MTNSVLEQYRRFLAFRKQHPAFAKGEIAFTEPQGDVLLVYSSLRQRNRPLRVQHECDGGSGNSA